MALDPVTNFGIVTVSTGYDASATSIVLTSGHGAKLPSTFSYNLTWWNSTDYSTPADDPNVEIVRVTGRSTDTLTVTRAQEGTSAATHNTGGKTYKMMLGVTAKTIKDINSRTIAVKVVDDSTAITTGDGKFIFTVPEELNGMNLVKVQAGLSTASTSGLPNITFYNLTDSTDMLSTALTIDANEYTSATAATAAVINTSYDDVATGDRIEINIDGAGTGAKGLIVYMTFQTP